MSVGTARLPEVTRPMAIRVVGSCGHEWVAVTVKAPQIRAGKAGDSAQHKRPRLNCPECRLVLPGRGPRGGIGEVMVYVTASETRRRCATKGCTTVLNSYNTEDHCGAHS